MTTNITINPAGHFVLVEIIDNYRSPGGLRSFSRSEQIIPPKSMGGQPFIIHSTTTRTIGIVDLEEPDDRVMEWKSQHQAKAHPARDLSPAAQSAGAGTREDPLNQKGAEVDTSDTRQTRGLTDEFVSGLRETRTKSDY